MLSADTNTIHLYSTIDAITTGGLETHSFAGQQVMIEIAELREQMRRLGGAGSAAWGIISSGFSELDAVLPDGGLRRGTLVEWLSFEPAMGNTLCCLRAASMAMADERPLVIVEDDATFHPPGLQSLVDWRRVLLARCPDRRHLEWAVDQSLRTSGVGAVLVRYDVEDERRMRRWQLAAESSGVIGLVARCLPRQPEVCFSDVRIGVTSLRANAEGRQVRLELLRSRQGGRGAAIDVRLDDDAHPLSSAHALSTRRRAVGS